jgi:hypothetical protein
MKISQEIRDVAEAEKGMKEIRRIHRRRKVDLKKGLIHL